jgi:hypothetical protein
MVWDIPREERPNHVCNPWVWIPDAPVREVAIQINTVDEIMDHLRTIPRHKALQALKLVFLVLHVIVPCMQVPPMAKHTSGALEHHSLGSSPAWVKWCPVEHAVSLETCCTLSSVSMQCAGVQPNRIA